MMVLPFPVLVLCMAAVPPTVPPLKIKPTVAVFRLEPKHGVPAGAADLLTDNLLAEIRGSGAFGRVVSPSDIAIMMRPEEQQFLVKCASDECALMDNELAGALGVTHVIVGNLGKLGNTYLLNLRLLDVRSSVLLASLSERASGATEEALLNLVAPSVRKLLREGNITSRPPAAAEPAPSTKTAGNPFARRLLWSVAAGLGGAGAVAAVAAVVAWGVSAGALAVDVSGGWRPGAVHSLTATQGTMASAVVAFGGVLGVITVLALMASAITLGVSGVVS